MAKLCIVPGSTSVSLIVFISDSISAEGLGKTGLTYTSAGLTCYYVRPGGIAQPVTLAYLAAPTTVYASGGFIEISAVNMPGLYRFDIPNAALAVGARSVVVMLKGAMGMSPVLLEIDLRAEVDVRYWKGSVAPNNTGDAYAFLPTYTNQVLAAITTMRGADSDTLKTLSDHLDAISGAGGSSLGSLNDLLDAMPEALVQTLRDADPPVPVTVHNTQDIADVVLMRDWTEVTGTVPDRSTLNALRFIRNKWIAEGSVLTVYQEDDSTPAWTAALTANAMATPIVGVQPNTEGPVYPT